MNGPSVIRDSDNAGVQQHKLFVIFGCGNIKIAQSPRGEGILKTGTCRRSKRGQALDLQEN